MDKSSFPSNERGTVGQGVGSPSFSTGSALGGSTYSSTGADAGLGVGSMGGSGAMGSSDTRETVERAKDAAHTTVDRLASTAREWAGKIDERARGISDVPMRALDYSRSTVQEHPMQAILLSLLVGYVIGRFSGGRSTHFVEY